MTWIKTIPYAQANGTLLKLYDRVKGPDNNIDNIMLAHSLRPHGLNGHMSLYKNVLHHSANTVEKWILEMIGVYTSMLNKCQYCVEHHFAGMRKLLNDDTRAAAIRASLASEPRGSLLDARLDMLMDYASKLTLSPWQLGEEDINLLRGVGWDDGQILEINQVSAYFNYANRTVLGLGVNTDGDILGRSPNDAVDEQNWRHQ